MPLHPWTNWLSNHHRWKAKVIWTCGSCDWVGGELTDQAGHQRGSPDPSMASGPSQGLLEGDPRCHVKWLHHLSNICHVACLLVGPWIHVQWSFTIGSWSEGGNRLQGSSHGLYFEAQLLVGPWWGRPTPSLGLSKVHFLVQVQPVMNKICSCYAILSWYRGLLRCFEYGFLVYIHHQQREREHRRTAWRRWVGLDRGRKTMSFIG